MLIPDPDFFPIPDPGVQKEPDYPGSATLAKCVALVSSSMFLNENWQLDLVFSQPL
jgi:hypothetical protein